FATSYPIAIVESGRKIPIGRPTSNTTAYVLDERQEAAPGGVIGELYLGGDGLARGYLNRPEQTDGRFLPNPFSERSGERMDRTGDLVRYGDDGQLEFIGRYDNQIKLRGFRIEPGEIEAALMSNPRVECAVAVLREDGAGEKRLVAYVVPNAESAIDTQNLRFHLRERLPDYMVPSAFVVIERLTLTPVGKVDRLALHKIAPIYIQPRQDYIAPRTAEEEILAGIWAEVLGVDQISVNDDFFELGGHSLLATQVVSRIEQSIGIELRLRE